jgi:S-adenosyl-L-methionine hydrolase (adenosine-forming)
MAPRPVIVLLTDFGIGDAYVGVMKGVIAGICESALLIDLSHDIPRHDVRAAAFTLGTSWLYFPEGSVFLTVVDPGVGTDRRAVAARVGSRMVVGPDNGVFDMVLSEGRVASAVELTSAKHARAHVSDTFHGRDRFAPAAAWLAQGTPLEGLGATVELHPRLTWTAPRVATDRVEGEVLHVDRFGNLVTNIHRRLWPAVVDILHVQVGDHAPARLVRTYGEAAPGTLVAYFGSSERLEVAVTLGSAADRLGAGPGATVRAIRHA